MILDEQYWTERYHLGTDGWDIGYVSTPIKEYVDQLEDKTIKILIPGAGNSYEAEYIFEQGFKNVYVCDLSAAPLTNLKQRVIGFPDDQLIQGDFFGLSDQFDLVLEQTFFCALAPPLRKDYVDQMAKILKPSGKLAGVMFGREFDREGPPFGGNIADYKKLFSEKFDIRVMKPCTNSIPSRLGSELFINMKPR